MRYVILLVILISGCSAMAVGKEKKPGGEEVFDILFNSFNMPLDKEPLCNMKSTTRDKESLTLGQHISTNLSVSYESKNRVQIKSSCARSKFETGAKKIVDVWDCKLEILETSQDGKFVSSSMIAFSTDINKAGIIAGSLRCF